MIFIGYQDIVTCREGIFLFLFLLLCAKTETFGARFEDKYIFQGIFVAFADTFLFAETHGFQQFHAKIFNRFLIVLIFLKICCQFIRC